MLKRMEAVRENIETTVGNHNTKQVSRSDSTTVLTWLRDSQQDTRDNMIGLQNNLTDLQNKHELLEKSIETADQDLAAQEKPEEPKQSGGVKKFVLIGFLLGIVAVAARTSRAAAAWACWVRWPTQRPSLPRAWMPLSTRWRSGRTAVPMLR